jgi:anthranilate phosphoribosyltransferase
MASLNFGFLGERKFELVFKKEVQLRKALEFKTIVWIGNQTKYLN